MRPAEVWRRGYAAARRAIDAAARLHIVCSAYLLAGLVEFHRLAKLRSLALARRVFGRAEVIDAGAMFPFKIPHS